MLNFRPSATLAFAIVLAGCGKSDTAGPSGPLFLSVTGAGQSDTVGAILETPMVVQVHDGNGVPATLTPININSVPDNDGRIGITILDHDGNWLNYGRDVTDGSGRLIVRIRFAGGAGQAKASIEVPAGGLRDTVVFDVRPGRAARISGLQLESAVQVGGVLVLPVSGVVDRFNNSRADPIAYQVLAPSITLSGNTLTGISPDLAKLVVSAGTYRDTVRISVVPHAELALGGSSLAFAAADLSGYARQAGGGGFAEWLPDGSAVLTDGVQASGSWMGTLVATRPDGHTGAVVPLPSGMTAMWIPRMTRDGSELYFTGIFGIPPDIHFRLWRAKLDGSRTEPVPGIPEPETSMAAPSPDGKRLAYVALGGSGVIHFLDLERLAPLLLAVPGHSPRWSPTGDLIAFIAPDENNQLKVMAPDGSGIRVVGGIGTRYDLGFDWSPDGKWIVAKEIYPKSRLDFIHVPSGLVLPVPLPNEDAVLSPAWRP